MKVNQATMRAFAKRIRDCRELLVYGMKEGLGIEDLNAPMGEPTATVVQAMMPVYVGAMRRYIAESLGAEDIAKALLTGDMPEFPDSGEDEGE